jgi:hypothetical protein
LFKNCPPVFVPLNVFSDSSTRVIDVSVAVLILLPANKRASFARWKVPVSAFGTGITVPLGTWLTVNIDPFVFAVSKDFKNTTPLGFEAKYPPAVVTLWYKGEPTPRPTKFSVVCATVI